MEINLWKNSNAIEIKFFCKYQKAKSSLCFFRIYYCIFTINLIFRSTHLILSLPSGHLPAISVIMTTF